jgi:O-methyltransferase
MEDVVTSGVAMSVVRRARRLLRSAIYAIPYTQALWVMLNKAFDRDQRPRFSGWGMVTVSSPPWDEGGSDRLAREFAAVQADVLARVAAGQFSLSMFEGMQHPAKQIPKALQQLMWRHYFVFWSARYASMATRCPVKTLVECGVCDGLTAYFAMRAVSGTGSFKAYLYDAWGPMKAEQLLESEQGAVGRYSNLSLDQTKRNLTEFAGDTVFIKGSIPDSFENGLTPSEVVWLHIDLNASRPTTAVLNAFFDKMPSGAVILFDDYGRPRYPDTRIAVDKLLSGKPGLLLPIPTGQAVFFKH